MSARSCCCQAAVLGLLLLRGVAVAGPGVGEPHPLGLTPGDALPTRVPTNNQKMADAIALALRQSGHLKNYQIDISFQEKTALLSGNVSDQMQKDEALRIVQGIPGVERVIDRLEMREAIKRVQAEAPRNPEPALPVLPPPMAEPQGNGQPAPVPNPGPALGGTNPPPEPQPIFSAPPPNQAELGPPRMPPYAWPTYAPHNNYSRVAYPLSYPYNAWPYIGPFYPFPKVPPGWRNVKLEWDDGHWWFSRHATKYDWWRLRFW